jgi:putative acetyltransferase
MSAGLYDSAMPVIRPEADADRDAIAAVVRAAFGGEDEVALIAQLRSDGDALVSLVAAEGEAVLGHILFSRLGVEVDGAPVPAAALAPVAVRPDRQGQGIGAQLIEAGLEACRAAGIAAVIVLGHPDYYPKFGFSAELARKLRAPFSGDAFMALELVPGALAGASGSVRYAAAFGIED